MDIAQIQTISQNFTTQLEFAENGSPSSLAFIKNTIPSSPHIKTGETFQIMSIGGTIYVKALVRKGDTGIGILSLERGNIPQFTTKNIFLNFIADHTDPNVPFLAMNFAYPLLPTFINEKLDGIMQAGSKEYAFLGLVGKQVGQTIEEFIFAKTKHAITVSIANDTICLLLSTLTQKDPNIQFAAGIIGTGINFALFLDNTTLVNLEAGDFKEFIQSREGARIDAASIEPGAHLFEKEVAGAYLYKHFNLLAAEKGLSITPLLNSTDLTSLAQTQTQGIGDLATEVLAHSARLAAGVIAGIANYKKSDMTFVMQGSLFWEGYHYKETIQQTLPLLTPHSISFIKVEHADILGAAKLLA